MVPESAITGGSLSEVKVNCMTRLINFRVALVERARLRRGLVRDKELTECISHVEGMAECSS